MEKFQKLDGVVASVIRRKNIDTDMIIPKQFLKTLTRTGLGKWLFYEMRYDNEGNLRGDFILDKQSQTQILITGENFGCGSSREHAPWALLDYGIRCIVASSFADIFYNNCLKNGILPLVLSEEKVEGLMREVEGLGSNARLVVDLEGCRLVGPSGEGHIIEINGKDRERLLEGTDDITMTLKKLAKIEGYEKRLQEERSWLEIHSE